MIQSFIIRNGFWLVLFTFVSSVGSEPSPLGSELDPVPPGARITLYADQQEFFLGENVLIHFCLENKGNEPFEISTGGDYRGAGRHLRYKVTAHDETGHLVDDSNPYPMCLGGLVGGHTLKPGDKIYTSLPLMRYCQVENPGIYIIRATHDFGWKENGRKRPVGEIKIRFRMPDEQQAKWVVSNMLKLPENCGSIWGERAAPYPDFSCLMHPVYLGILTELARDGDERAFEGLRRIPTVEATQMLIQLAGDSDAKFALQAIQALNWRLPYPKRHFGPGSSKDRRESSIRGRLVARTWDESLVPEVRAFAGKLLSSDDLASIKAAAFMIKSVGTNNDAPVILAAIKAIRNDTFSTRDNVEDNILDYPQPLTELLGAMDELRDRGYSLGTSLSGDAEFLLYFHFLKDDPKPRSKHWMTMLDAYGTGSWYPVREAAVRSIPKPMPKECMDFVMKMLEDRDLGVCRAACSVAGASGDSAFIRPLLDIVATEHHDWLWREATDSARALGAGFELLEASAERLNNKTLCPLALRVLQVVLEVPSGSSGSSVSRSERLRLREAWRRFLTQHEDEIRAGKRFKLSDPAVTPALVGRARSWKLEDGTIWPSQTETSGHH